MKIQKRSNMKRLAAQRRLYAVVVAGLLLPAFPLSALAAGIAAVSGSGTTVATQNGVSVVSIATPSASGLSHNRYTDFNVGAAGAVLNNSLSSGSSQLAGQLGANANLQGRNARVILNEVVSANASQLLGQQEVFGQRADLVLANPNGITCNGCGVINVSQATLAVAKPTVEDGVLTSLQVTKTDASLQVDGVVNAAGTDLLRLIAPSARIGGTVKGGQQVAVILGNNTVDTGSGQATAGAALANTDRRYDSTLFGAMQAGRISLLSTAAGVGVNLDAAQLNATDIDLTADQLTIRGKVSDSTAKDYHSHSNWWNWGRAGREYLDIDETDKRQSMARSQLTATGTLNVKANDSLTVNAADISGKDVSLAGKNVSLGTQATTDSYRYYYRDAINWWSYQKTDARDVTTQHGARVTASGQLHLDADQNAGLTGAQLTNTQGDIRLNTGNDLTLSAAVNRDARSYYENETNNTIINSSTTTNNYDNKSLLASRVDANKSLALDAGHDLTLNAAQLKSGNDSLLSASGALKVDAQSYQTSQSAGSVYSNTGGLFGGSDTSSGDSKTLYQGSDLQAGGQTYLTADGDVRIRGSRLKATNGVYAASRTGGIGIDVATGQTLSQASGSTQTVFGITTSTDSSQTQQQIVTGSSLHSDADLQLISATDTAIIGSLLKAAGDLGISAAGGLSIASATAQTTATSTTSTTQGYATGGATADAQYQGNTGIQTVTTTSTTTTGTVAGSTLQSGGDTSLSAGQTVAVSGSSVQSGGDLSVTGSNVSVTAAQSTTSTQSTDSTVGGGLYATAGVAQVSAGVEVNATTTTTNTAGSTAVVSSLSAGGDVIRTADGAVSDQGTVITAGGAVTTQAATVNSLAASTTSTSTTTTDSTHVEVGPVLDTGVVSPVYETVKNTVATGEVNLSTLSGASLPTTSVELAVNSGTTTTATATSTAVTSSVQAGSISIQAGDTATLEGTQLSAGGNVSLGSGGDTQILAATNTQSVTSSSEGGSGTVSVGVTLIPQPAITGVSVGGDYQQNTTTTQASQAVTGSIASGSSLQVSSGGNLTVTGDLSAAGNVSLSAGGELAAAVSRDTTYSRSESEGASATVSVSLNDGNVQSVGVDLTLQATSNDQRSNTVSGGSVSAGGTLSLSSGGNTTLDATQVQAGAVAVSTGGDLLLQDAQSTTTLNTSSTAATLDATVPVQAGIGEMASMVTGIAGSGVSVDMTQSGSITPVSGSIVIQ